MDEVGGPLQHMNPLQEFASVLTAWFGCNGEPKCNSPLAAEAQDRLRAARARCQWTLQRRGDIWQWNSLVDLHGKPLAWQFMPAVLAATTNIVQSPLLEWGRGSTVERPTSSCSEVFEEPIEGFAVNPRKWIRALIDDVGRLPRLNELTQ